MSATMLETRANMNVLTRVEHSGPGGNAHTRKRAIAERAVLATSGYSLVRPDGHM